MDFEIPDAKRVRREDLYDRNDEGSEEELEVDEELEMALQEKLAQFYGSTILSTSSQIAPLPTKPPPAPDGEEDEPQGYEFRLFSTATTSKIQGSEAYTAQKIVLEVEEQDVAEGGFVKPHRDRRYYFVEKAEGEKRWRFEVAAVKGEDVLQARSRRAWGLECPWRVMVVKVVGKSKTEKRQLEGVEITDVNDNDQVKKKKPGKKRRIILRQREKKRVEIEEKRKKDVELKNESERDKKTRRNREKKLKKRLKEKAEKDAKRAEGGAEDGNFVTAAANENLVGTTAGQINGIGVSSE